MSARVFGREVSDETLVKEYLAGETEAFAELYRRHADTVRGFLWRRTAGDADLLQAVDLDDLVQDAFVLAMERVERPEKFRSGGEHLSIGQRLCGCAALVLKRAHWERFAARKAVAATTDDLRDELREDLAPWTAGPVEITAELRAAVAGLDEDYRRVVELRYGEGQSIEQTAAMTGYTVDQVTYFARCGLEALRGHRRRRCPHDPMDKWARLVTAAREVIDEVGAEKATGTQIARRAGLNQNHINAKFGSLEGLLRAALGDGAPAVIRRPTREVILDAARQVIAEVGRDATTSAAVAKRAGLSTRVIRKYFGSHAGLLDQAVPDTDKALALRREIERLQDQLAEIEGRVAGSAVAA